MSESTIEYTHYTNLGCSMQPTCADSEGFLKFRKNFQKNIKPSNWTYAECFIDCQEQLIEKFRNKTLS